MTMHRVLHARYSIDRSYVPRKGIELDSIEDLEHASAQDFEEYYQKGNDELHRPVISIVA